MFVSVDGQLCTPREMLRATAVDRASDVYPLIGVPAATALYLHGSVRPECSLQYLERRVGEPVPTLTPTQQKLQLFSTFVETLTDDYAAHRMGQ